jgi:hypothetical protein
MFLTFRSAGCAEVAGASGFESRPLCDRASARPSRLPGGRTGARSCVRALSRPASGPVFPRLLATEHPQIEHVIAVIHYLEATRGRPVSLEDFRFLPQVADNVHPADAASNQERFERAQRRVPGHLPTQEGAISGALFVGTLAKHSESDVARMEIGQLADLRGDPSATFAPLRRRMAGVPDEVIGNQLPSGQSQSTGCWGPPRPSGDDGERL